MALSPKSRRIEVTPMRLSDLDAVMAIERGSFRAPWSRQVFIEELEREWAHIVVVRERASSGGASRVVAFCNYWLVRDEVHILNVAVAPEVTEIPPQYVPGLSVVFTPIFSCLLVVHLVLGGSGRFANGSST